jgi:hypothetical protein
VIALASTPRAISKGTILSRSAPSALGSKSTPPTAKSAAPTIAETARPTAPAESSSRTCAVLTWLTKRILLARLIPSALSLAEQVRLLLRLLQTAIQGAIHQESFIGVGRCRSVLLLFGIRLRGFSHRVDLRGLVQIQVAKSAARTRRAASRTTIGGLLALGHSNFESIVGAYRRVAHHQIAAGCSKRHHVHLDVPRAAGQVQVILAVLVGGG